MAAEGRRDDELTQIVRECVRNEIELQRSGRQGNTNLLMRTRELIASSARSASQEVANSLPAQSPGTPASVSVPRVVSPGVSGGSHSQAEGHITAKTSTTFKRAATSQHPWRFKKGKQKKSLQKQEFYPKAVHLLDKATAEHEGPDNYIPEYAIKDDMILLKGFIELGTGQTEAEIRESITEVLKQRFPFVKPDHFDFVKRDRNKVTTPVVSKSLKWDYKHLKELCGQGKIYVRLNIARECIEVNPESQSISSGEDDEDLMLPAFSSSNTSRGTSSSMSAAIKTSTNSLSNEQDTVELVFESKNHSSSSGTTLDQYSSAATTSSVVIGSWHDRERLSEVVPFASEEEIDNALSEFGSIDCAANALVHDCSMQEDEKEIHVEEDVHPSLVKIINNVGKKLTGKKKKIEIDPDDIISDAISYYKSLDFDPHCPLRVTYTSLPAIDSGGVLRQFYSDLFEGLAEGKLMELFEGEINRKVPSYRPQAVMSGLLEMVGKMISHSIAQGGPGFPFLASPCYYYLVTGDTMCAMAYCDVWDIPDPFARNIVLQIVDAKESYEINNLCNDEAVLNLLTQCGETSLLNMSTKTKVIQSVLMYEVISKRKVALDQLQSGLKILGILDEMQRYPQLFQSVFTFKNQELTSEIVNHCFKYPEVLSEQEQNVKSMITRFIDQSPSERLMQFMQYCTGSKSIPSVRSFQIKVEFHSEGYIHCSTCTFSLMIPNCFTSYGLFEVALNSAICSLGKSFTTV